MPKLLDGVNFMIRTRNFKDVEFCRTEHTQKKTKIFDKSLKEQDQCTGKANTRTIQEIKCSFEMNMEYWLENRAALPLKSQILNT